jgi:hypothetical protein
VTRRAIALLSIVFTGLACASRTWYRRAPEAERSANLARAAIRDGMSLPEVVQAMVEVRGTEQDVSLTFHCQETKVEIVLNAGQQLAQVGSTRVLAAGFASIWAQDFEKQSLKTWGFQRQGEFLAAIRSRESELVACDKASLAFNATPEGACGHDVVDVSFGSDRRVSAVGPVQPTTCVR